MKFLAESNTYRVYSIYENIYLKIKSSSTKLLEYSNDDKYIGCHYGDPTSAVILENHVVVTGCGITIYDIKKNDSIHLFDGSDAESSDKAWWTNGAHQDLDDNQSTEFRFVSYNSSDKVRVFRMSVVDNIAVELD